jgi:sugar phosphate isomerase/epimerase
MTNTPRFVASYYTLSGSPNGMPSRFTFDERVAAAANAGYTGVGLTLFDYEACLAAGKQPEQMREVAEDHGIEITEVEFLGFDPEQSVSAASDPEQKLCEMASALGARHLNVSVGRPPTGATDLNAAARALAEVAKRCAAHDLTLAFEFMPFLAIGNVNDAVRLVEACGEPNVGLLVDAYHFFRGGSSLDDLSQVDPALIVGYQLSDVPAAAPDDLLSETRQHRLLPGHGELDLIGLLSAGHADSSTVVGVEMLSDALRLLDVEAEAKATFDAVQGVWQQYAEIAKPASRMP